MLLFFCRQPYSCANQSKNNNQIVAVPPSNPETVTHSSVAESSADLVVTQIMDQTAMQTQRFRAKATNNQYGPRVVEVEVWCNQMYVGTSLETRFAVTEGKSKTNHLGKEEFAATLRHKDVLTCPQSKIAFYFARRFDICEDELPNFENNESWFNTKLFHNKVFQEKKKTVSY